jgi:uncharacterized membrane protein
MAQTTAQLHADHRNAASPLQQALERLSAILGWPGFVVALAVLILVWIGANLAMGHRAPDPPPFSMLQVAASVGALLMAALIFSTQRRDSQRDGHRDELVLELSVVTDQKVSKVIELLEEHRRDNPGIEDRYDGEAHAMSTPTDAQAVLEAIKDAKDETG